MTYIHFVYFGSDLGMKRNSKYKRTYFNSVELINKTWSKQWQESCKRTRQAMIWSNHILLPTVHVTPASCVSAWLGWSSVIIEDNVSLWKIVLVYGNDDKHRNPCSIVKQQLYISYYSEKRWKQIYQLFH